MPNTTVRYLASLTRPSTPASAATCVIDEYVETDLAYLDALRAEPGSTQRPLVADGRAGHQLHRALDLAALAPRAAASP